MKVSFNEKLVAYLALISGLSVSAVAIYYSVAGLTAIYPAAVIPIIVMGIVIEVGKLSMTLWLKQNWKSSIGYKLIMIPSVVVLMAITSAGVFGFLSKAHSDQSLVSGDVQAKLAIYDEKIKIERDNIEADRKAMRQMDEGVDQIMGRSTNENGADRAMILRRGQQKERTRLLEEITEGQKRITALNEERAPVAAEMRKVDAEVGPIKYIAALVYGANPDSSLLERAVIIFTIMIVSVLDPLAIILLLASQYSFQRFRDQREETVDVEKPVTVVYPVETKTTEETPTEAESDSYIQNEEQKDSSLWTSSTGTISAKEYIDQVSKKNKVYKKWVGG